MTLPLSCRRLLAAVLVAGWPLVLSGAATALAQTQSTAPSQNAAPAQPPPVQTQGTNQPNAAPSRPVREQGSPNAGTAGYYWYWVVAVIALIVLFWGVPRLVRMLKGSRPGRKP